MTEDELELRRAIFLKFAETGAPPRARTLDRALLDRLAEAHVVVLDDRGEIRMAHPFAAHREGARVAHRGREWWGNCAWDGLGIAAALGFTGASISAGGVPVAPGAVFHVAVPAARWWDDIAYT